MSRKNIECHLRVVNQHIDQCDGSCEISDDELVNMEGLPLSLVVKDEEGSAGSLDRASGEQVEEGSQSLEGLEESLRAEEEEDDEESDSDSEHYGRKEEDLEANNLNLNILDKMPTVVVPSEDDDNADGSDGDSADIFLSEEEEDSGDKHGKAAATSSRISYVERINNNHKRLRSEERSESQSSHRKIKKAKVDSSGASSCNIK